MLSDYPGWESFEFYQNILRKSENNESIEVKNIKSEAVTAAGDNYMSNMVRVGVEYSLENDSGERITEIKSLILKIALKRGNPNGVLVRNNAHDDNAFAHYVPRDKTLLNPFFKPEKLNSYYKEIKMMRETLVEMTNILNDKKHRLNCDLFYSEIGDPSILVMEDLSERGFRMGDRQAGLDFEHCLLVMRGLAKFHASSVALHEKDPDSMNSYQNIGFFSDNCPEEITTLLKNAMKNLANEIANWPELNPRYSEKILKLSDVCCEKVVDCVKPEGDDFYVLNHGDCWLNNVMFRYDDNGKVIDSIFIDFQACDWNTLGIDLWQFFSTSPTDDVLNYRGDELVKEYLKYLTETLKKLGCKTKSPSLESFQQILRKKELLSFLVTSVSLPLIFIKKEDAVSLSKLLKAEKEDMNPVYKEQKFRDVMVRRLQAWDSRGLFDV